MNGPERHWLTDVIARPYPARLAGDLTTFGFDRTKKQFTLKYAPSNGVTEIVIPRACVFPSGFTLTHDAGIVLAFDAAQPAGLRVVSNAGNVDARAFAWDEQTQTLSVREWLSGASVTIEIR